MHAGCRLRLGNCRLLRRNKLTGQPLQLLPTAETVLVLDSLEAAPQLLATQLFSLSQVRAKLSNVVNAKLLSAHPFDDILQKHYKAVDLQYLQSVLLR